MTEQAKEKGAGVAFRSYVPTIVLLAIIIAVAVWAFYSGIAVPKGAPSITGTSGTLLVIVGLIAGLLGGIIGTGGCSVMLPAIHFWLHYPAPLII